MGELVRELPRDGSLTVVEVGAYNGALVGECRELKEKPITLRPRATAVEECVAEKACVPTYVGPCASWRVAAGSMWVCFMLSRVCFVPMRVCFVPWRLIPRRGPHQRAESDATS